MIELSEYTDIHDELDLIRHRIELLLEWRILTPLTEGEQAEYDTLCRYERELMGRN